MLIVGGNDVLVVICKEFSYLLLNFFEKLVEVYKECLKEIFVKVR